jgi:hypothetical protein
VWLTAAGSEYLRKSQALTQGIATGTEGFSDRPMNLGQHNLKNDIQQFIRTNGIHPDHYTCFFVGTLGVGVDDLGKAVAAPGPAQ